jgi:YD repeat-containing protein
MKSKFNSRWCISVFVLIAGIAMPSPPVQSATGAVVYTYDALGRIITASYDTGAIIIYTYDANGNRQSQVVNINSGTLTWTSTATPCTTNCWGKGLWN